jgi:hypothetical protein
MVLSSLVLYLINITTKQSTAFLRPADRDDVGDGVGFSNTVFILVRTIVEIVRSKWMPNQSWPNRTLQESVWLVPQ